MESDYNPDLLIIEHREEKNMVDIILDKLEKPAAQLITQHKILIQSIQHKFPQAVIDTYDSKNYNPLN